MIQKRKAIGEYADGSAGKQDKTVPDGSFERTTLLSQEFCEKWKASLQFLFGSICEASGKPPEEIWSEVEEYVFSLQGEQQCAPDDVDWVKQIVVYDAPVDQIEGTRVAARYKDRHPMIEAMNRLISKYI